MKSELQKARLSYIPKGPSQLHSFLNLIPVSLGKLAIADEITPLFPHLKSEESVGFKESDQALDRPLNIGMVFSGGPAAGAHNAAAAVYDALQEIHPSSRFIGFLDGPSGIVDNHWILIDKEKINSFRNMGGFHLLGSGRTKIETEEQLAHCRQTCEKHDLDGLVIVGGDDSNTNAAFLAEYFLSVGCKTAVVGVPKTIDGDLKNDWIETSFGFDSASKTYSEIIGNVASDALSQNKYYFFIKVMGRTASHLVLECALQTQVNLALISEEIKSLGLTLSQIIEDIADMIVERSKRGKFGGVILIPEGLIEFIPEFKESIEGVNQKNDPHGNIPVSKIETEKWIISLVEKELQARGFSGNFSAQSMFVGYEGRCCLPSNFDCDYGYQLGKVAVLLIAHKKTGMMAVIQGLSKKPSLWSFKGIPLISMMKWVQRGGKQKAVIAQSLVDLKGKTFLAFLQERGKWRLDDHYSNPGPIQFFGPEAIVDRLTKGF